VTTPTITQLKRDYYASQLGLSPQQEAAMSITDLEESFFLGGGPLDTSMDLMVGEETLSRLSLNNAGALAAGQFRSPIMRAKKTEQITRLKMITATTAAVGTTDAWMACYEVVQQGDGSWLASLVGSTATDPTLFSVASTPYTRNLVAPFTKKAGHYYSVCALLIGTTTAPTLLGVTLNSAVAAGTNESALSPPISIQQSALAALPTQQAVPGNVSSSTILHYGVMLP
jgi:hypothetical protein